MVNEVSRVGVGSRPHSEEIHYPSARHNENYEEIVRIKNMCRSALSPDNIQGNPAKALNYKPNESKYYGRFNLRSLHNQSSLYSLIFRRRYG